MSKNFQNTPCSIALKNAAVWLFAATFGLTGCKEVPARSQPDAMNPDTPEVAGAEVVAGTARQQPENIASSKFLLADENGAKAVIYLAPDATPTAKYAAEELRDHLEKITGARLDIVDRMPGDPATPVVLVGPSEEAAQRGVSPDGLPSEGFRIVSGDNWLVLLGDDTSGSPFVNPRWWQQSPVRNGTLTAVYRFLENVCGVRWFMPGELGSVIPRRARVGVPALDLTGAPSMEDRLPHFGKESSGDIQPEVQKWMLRVGFGRAVTSYFNHSFLYLSPASKDGDFAEIRKLRETKPEIYAMLPDGRRDFDITSYGDGNLCLSQPETVRLFVEVLRERLDANPGRMEESVIPNDVWVPCTCDLCLERIDPDVRRRVKENLGMEEVRGTPRLSLPRDVMKDFRAASSKLLADFHVKVAREVYKSHPDRLVGALAGYGGVGFPEDYTAIPDLPPNLAFMITKTRADFWKEEYRDEIHESLRKWKEITPHVFVWEYYIWNWRPWRERPKLIGYPVLFSKLLEEDVRAVNEIGIRGEKIENEEWVASSPGLNHLMPYLTGRLLYDPSLQVRDLLEDYYTKFYGAAAEEMKAFWVRAEECWMRPLRGLHGRHDADKVLDIMFPAEDMQYFFDRLAAGKAMVPAGSPEYQRIALIEKEMEVNRDRIGGGARTPEFHSTALFPAPAVEGTFQSGWSEQSIELPVDGRQAAKVKVAHDVQNLYLTFEVAGEGAAAASGAAWFTEQRGVPVPADGADTLAIQLRPDAKAPGRTATILVNSGGENVSTFSEGSWPSDAATLSATIRSAVASGPDGWSGTISIPWDTLGVRLSPGMEVRASFANHRADGQVARWPAPVGAGGTQRFGSLFFPED